MSKKDVRKDKKDIISTIIIIVLFIILLGIFIFLLNEQKVKNKYKEQIKEYILNVNEYAENKTYEYDGVYDVDSKRLFSKDNKDSFKIDYDKISPQLGSSLTIKEHSVVSGVFYIEKYKVTYKNNKITITYGKINESKEELLKKQIEQLEKLEYITLIDYNMILESLDDTNINMKDELEKLKKKIKYHEGDVIKFNPVDNKKCDSGDNCYSFNVISKDEDEKDNITVILSNNIIETKTAWYSGGNNNSKGAVTALELLNENTKTWNVDARLITYDEAVFLGCSFNLNSCPVWLYQNLDNSNGYWTSSARSNVTSAWYISKNGALKSYTVNADKFSIRPVIEIKKELLA